MIVLAGLPRGAYRGAAAIAEQNDAPANYLGKILQQLARRHVVDSQKGLGGGFRIC
jgi:DNA-binding IscR family transcriptional regulator